MAVEIIKGVCVIVRASGEIDIANVRELDIALDGAAKDSPGGFVIDLSAVTYIDAAGIRAIFDAYERVHSGRGRLAVVAEGMSRRLFQIFQLDALPDIVVRESLSEAEEALCRHAGDTE